MLKTPYTLCAPEPETMAMGAPWRPRCMDSLRTSTKTNQCVCLFKHSHGAHSDLSVTIVLKGDTTCRTATRPQQNWELLCPSKILSIQIQNLRNVRVLLLFTWLSFYRIFADVSHNFETFLENFPKMVKHATCHSIYYKFSDLLRVFTFTASNLLLPIL